MAKSAPPPGMTLAAALGRSEPLTGLMQRVRESQARFDKIKVLLPAALRDGVRPGPLDDAAWVLLVANAASASKVRQWLPALDQALREAGLTGPPIKIKVRPR
jgi:hypothetical protein